MSRLSKLTGKPKEIEIQGEKFSISPLKGKDLHLFMDKGKTAKEQAQTTINLIYLSLLPGMPDVTKEEIENLDATVLNKIALEIAELNGLGEDEKVKKIKEAMNNAGKSS